MSPKMPTPVEIGSPSDSALDITWSDGHPGTHSWINLRVSCPCAACAGEWRYRPPKLRAEDVRPDIHPMRIGRVGAYALRFEWNDGHNTGLYTFASLRYDLCECEECRLRRAHEGRESRPDAGGRD